MVIDLLVNDRQTNLVMSEYRTVTVPQLREMLSKLKESDIAIIERLAKCRCLYRDMQGMLIALRLGKDEYGPVRLTYETDLSCGGQTNG